MRLHRVLPAACLLTLLPPLAAAQGAWSGSLVAASDERFRGRSVTGEKPSLRGTLAWDHTTGAYAGASLSNAAFDHQHHAALVFYGGASGAFDSGPRWDAGLTTSRFVGDPYYNYSEAYLGAGGERWSLRLAASPSYYGSGAATAYAELGVGWPLATDWQLQLHAGALRRTDGRQGNRIDARVALAWDAFDLQWQLAATALSRGGPFGAPAGEHRQRWTASATLAF